LGFRCKKRVEYAFNVFQRQPYAGVADRNFDFTIRQL
jgi:hypothetical protein